MSVQVIDLNEETKEEPPALETIEEESTPVVTPEIANEIVEEKRKNLEKNPRKKKSNLNPNPKQNQKQVIQGSDTTDDG